MWILFKLKVLPEDVCLRALCSCERDLNLREADACQTPKLEMFFRWSYGALELHRDTMTGEVDLRGMDQKHTGDSCNRGCAYMLLARGCRSRVSN